MKEDIFDKIMKMFILSFYDLFYKRYREVILYLFFGVMTFLISIFTFATFNMNFGINELTANILSWIIAVLFAFFTNRIWVFAMPTDTIQAFFKQMLSFFNGRIVTLLLEEIILFVFITKLGFPSMGIKIVAQVIVIISNYVISKLFVFKSK